MAEFLSISRIIQKAPAKYARAFLHTETDHFDATYFVWHQLETIQQAIDGMEEYLEQKAREIRQADKILKEPSRFNHRQRALLAHALRHPNAAYTIAQYRREQGVVYQTARTDLLELERLGYLKRQVAGRAFRFTPGPALQKGSR